MILFMSNRFPSIQEKHDRAIATQCRASLSALRSEPNLKNSSSSAKASSNNVSGAGSSLPSVSLPIPLSPVKNTIQQHAPSAMLVHHEIEGQDAQEQARNLVLKIVQSNGVLLKSHVHEIFRYQASQGNLTHPFSIERPLLLKSNPFFI
jgi:hypothetical protein